MLRALEPEDLDLLYTIENDRSQWWIGTQTAPYSRYRLRDYIANTESDIYKDEQVRFIIEDDGKTVGMVDLFDFSARNQRAEIGIALLREAQGRGLARQAINDIIDYARDVINMRQLYGVIPESNTASVRMLEACGFSQTACLKDWLKHGQKYENALLLQLFL